MTTTQTTSTRTSPRGAAESAFVPVLIRVPRLTPHAATRSALNRGRGPRPSPPVRRRRLRREVRWAGLSLGLGVPLAWGVLTLAGPAWSLLSRPVPAALPAMAEPAPPPEPARDWVSLSIAPVEDSRGSQVVPTGQSVAPGAPGDFRLPTLGFEGSLDAGH